MSPRTFKTESAFRYFMASRKPGAFHVTILHDDACSPSRCTCRPWYRVTDLTADSVIQGTELEAAWRKDTAS